MAFPIVPVNQPVATTGSASAIDGAGNFTSTTLIHAANWAIVRLVGSTVGQNAVWTLAGDNGQPVDFANGPLASMGQILVPPGERLVLTINAATTFAVVNAQFVGLMSPSLEDLLPHYTPSPNPLGATVRGAVSVVGGEGNFTDIIITGLTGAATQYRLVGSISNGPPTSGTFQTGDAVLERVGPPGWWICTAGGTPGSWSFDGLNASGFLLLPGHPSPQGAGPAFPLDVSQDGVGVRIGTPSSAQFASAQYRMELLAAALPNAGHEKWVFRTMRPGAGGVASNSRLQLYRANPAETTLQEYLRVDETTGVVHIADSTVVSAGTPSPGLSDVSVGDLAVTGLTGAVSASRYVGATTGGAPTAGTFAVGDYVLTTVGNVWVCVTAGTPGTWRRADGWFGLLGTSVFGTVATLSSRLLQQTGSTVATTDVNGIITVTFPNAFPNGIQSILATPGDNSASLGQVQVIQSSVSLTAFNCGCLTNLGAVINTLAVRVNWLAVGS